MGLADFGVTAAGTGYAYSTSAFLGNVSIQSLVAHAKFTSGGTTYTTNQISLQLNAELVLSHPGKANITYWMQDVVVITTSNNQIAFNNNIWNLSAGGTLPSGTIVGNGSIEDSEVYAAVAPPTDPGAFIDLAYPANVSAKFVASTIQGIPEVGFEYDDGFGWVTYDNVSLPWASAWTCHGFVVDGFAYTPNGLYYDVEWTEGGPGNGIDDTQDKGNFTMGLDYYNGHNFQAVENAYDFGGNTAEGMQNVLPTFAPASDGVPLVHEAAGAGGKLGMVYNRAGVAVLNVTSIYANSTLTVGPDTYHVRGGEVNLTLAPGTYNLTLSNGSFVGDRRTVTLTAGEYLALPMGHLYYPVWLNGTGLPQGTPWSVTIGNQTYSSSNGSIHLILWAGSYPYSVTAIPGYHLSGWRYSGSLLVSTAVRLAVRWGQVVYPVTATTDGLPTGVPWSIAIANSTYRSTNASLNLSLSNGTYPYSIGVAYGFVAADPSDLLPVAGQAVSIEVSFLPRYATLSGTVTPAGATVEVDGTLAEAGQPTYSMHAIAGTYELTAVLSGYHSYHANVTLTPGNTTVHNIVLEALSAPPSTGHSTGPSWLGSGGSGTYALVGIAILVIGVAAVLVVLWARSSRQR